MVNLPSHGKFNSRMTTYQCSRKGKGQNMGNKIIIHKNTKEIELIGFEELTDTIYFNFLPSTIAISSKIKPSTDNHMLFEGITNNKIQSKELVDYYRYRGVTDEDEYIFIRDRYIESTPHGIKKD